MTRKLMTADDVTDAMMRAYEVGLGTGFTDKSDIKQGIAAAINASGCVLVPRWLVFNVGCIECGVSSNVVGMYASSEEAERVAALATEELNWREGGQNSFEVFDLLAPQAAEYRAMLAADPREQALDHMAENAQEADK